MLGSHLIKLPVMQTGQRVINIISADFKQRAVKVYSQTTIAELCRACDWGSRHDGHHGGDQQALREVPFFTFDLQLSVQKVEHNTQTMLDQRCIAPTVLSVLGVHPPESMQSPSLV